MGSSSRHTNFFSYLRHVEKRLKSENPSQPSNLPPSPLHPQQPAVGSNDTTSTDSLSSPIYLDLDQLINTSTLLQDSEPPLEFLSGCREEFPPTQNNPHQNETDLHHPEANCASIDEISMLVQLLGLAEEEREGEEKMEVQQKVEVSSRHCDSEFYTNIVGFKGPKCVKESERLEGWIKHFSSSGGKEERREPLRLAHLLLGKAAFVSKSGGNGGSVGAFEFPSTVEEFLQNDPPTG